MRNLSFGLLFLAVSLFGVSPHDGNWSWWRGPSHSGVASSGQNLPLRWSSSEKVIWKSPIPGRGHGSPIVFGGKVLLCSADEKKQIQSVYCYSLNSGKLLWETAVHRGKFMKRNKKASQASSTPACDGERIWVSFVNGGAAWTTALSLDGEILWQTRITDYVVHQAYGASPMPYKDLLLVAADNKKAGVIAGLRRKTGEIVWKRKRPKMPNYPSPVVVRVAGKDQLILTGCELVTALDPLTGQLLWETKGATTECVTSTVTDGRHVYSSGGYPKNHVSAFLADGSGKVAWENRVRVYVPSMIFHEGYLYAVADAGIAYCWKSNTGEEQWKARLGGTHSASLTLVDGLLYAANEEGEFFVYKANPKSFQLLATNKLGDEVFASPAVAGGRLYLRVAHRDGSNRQEMIYCIGK